MDNMENTKQIRTPFFSVVIPVYNKEPHIARSIESVLNQSYTNFELIIICDPSTDNSNLEVEKFSDPRIRIFHRDVPGPGGYAARNLGIRNAKSAWIAFLDADDEWYSDYLENAYNLILQFPESSFVGSGWKTIDPDSTEVESINKYFEYYQYKKHHIINFKEYLFNEVYLGRPFYTSTAIIKKSLLLDSGLFPEGKAKRGGDVDTWLRCVSNSEYITIGGFIGASYYRDSVNMVTKSSADDAKALRQSIKSIIDQTKDKETINFLKKFSNLYTIRAWYDNLYLDTSHNNINLFKDIYYEVENSMFKALGRATLSVLPKHTILNFIKIKNTINP